VLRSPQDSSVKAVCLQTLPLSFVVCPSVLDDLPPLVAVASSSSCPDVLRVFNCIVKVSKIVAYLLRGEVHVDFSGSNVDDCFNGAEERSLKDDGWIIVGYFKRKQKNPQAHGYRCSFHPGVFQISIFHREHECTN